MSELPSIYDVTIDDVQAVVRRSLHPELDAEQIADYTASVDWSGVSLKRPKIADALGELELRTCEFRDGMMSEADYVAYLLSLLPEEERARFAGARRD